jgi:hypothetical protein
LLPFAAQRRLPRERERTERSRCSSLFRRQRRRRRTAWIEARSRNVTLLTDAGGGRACDILFDLEQLRRLVSEALPVQAVDSPIPASIYAFESDQSFRDFIAFHGGGWRDTVRELPFQQYLHWILSYTAVDYPFGSRTTSAIGAAAECRIRDLVASSHCACELRNPERRCCLGRVNALVKRA